MPDDTPAVVRQTFRPGHYTLWCCAERSLSSVVDTRPVDVTTLVLTYDDFPRDGGHVAAEGAKLLKLARKAPAA